MAFSNIRAADFIQACLQQQDKRPSATELLAVDFLKPNEVHSVDWMGYSGTLFSRSIIFYASPPPDYTPTFLSSSPQFFLHSFLSSPSILFLYLLFYLLICTSSTTFYPLCLFYYLSFSSSVPLSLFLLFCSIIFVPPLLFHYLFSSSSVPLSLFFNCLSALSLFSFPLFLCCSFLLLSCFVLFSFVLSCLALSRPPFVLFCLVLSFLLCFLTVTSSSCLVFFCSVFSSLFYSCLFILISALCHLMTIGRGLHGGQTGSELYKRYSRAG